MSYPKIENYTLDRVIGRGGMAVVYSATSDKLKSRHAIKVLNVQKSRNRHALEKKFLSEARLLAALSHPNIVRVTDCGTTAGGRPWYAMDLVDGSTLADRLAQPAPPSDTEVAKWYHQIRSALAECHSRGIVHGDIKAENILIRNSDDAVLSDFGIARVTDEATRSRLDLTATTLPVALGTGYTLAPECRDGTPPTAAADVYSFGVVMHKLVTGIWFEGSQRAIERLGEYAPRWAPLLAHMLAADPTKRFESAAQLPDDAPSDESRPPRRKNKSGHKPKSKTTTKTPSAPFVGGKLFWGIVVFAILAILGYFLERQERQDAAEDRIYERMMSE